MSEEDMGEMSAFEPAEPFATEKPDAVEQPKEPLRLAKTEPQHMESTDAAEPPVQPALRKKTVPLNNRPRVAMMGEFSAGKSTLSNLLIGKEALPVKITATQLPPVWMSHGDQAPFRVGLDEQEHDVDPSLSGVSVTDTNHIRIFHESRFLKFADLIDMPGISDPNMAAEVWQRVLPNADIIVWCSHATQAWRQSEAAVWSTLPTSFHEKSILLLTRMDKILSERDQSRVIKRVERETEGLFRKVLPVSLIKALEARDDSQAWADSGADVLLESLMELIDEVAGVRAGRPVSRIRSAAPATSVDSSIGEAQKAKIVMPTRVRPRPLTSRPLPR